MMHPSDHYGAADGDHDDLPELPIPRPGEWSPMATGQHTPAAPPIAAPTLAIGGASFTAASTDEGSPEAAAEASDAAAAEEERRAAKRMAWELAAQLTSGMLANPSRGHASVKDAMGLFDQFLQEMHSYARISSEFDLLGSEGERRRSHGEYFQGVREDTATQTAPASPTVPPSGPTAATPRPAPAQPRPMGDYRPIPPGARGPYAPGSMAGSPPTDPSADEHAA